jgi:hypothetical protein
MMSPAKLSPTTISWDKRGRALPFLGLLPCYCHFVDSKANSVVPFLPDYQFYLSHLVASIILHSGTISRMAQKASESLVLKDIISRIEIFDLLEEIPQTVIFTFPPQVSEINSPIACARG